MKPRAFRIGVDLGGTNVRAGLVQNSKILRVNARPIHGKGTRNEVFEELCASIDSVMEKGVKSIGLGVPSIVNRKKGMILNTTNISSWENVPLKRLLEKRYRLPVAIDNDANCFALGERLMGAGRDSENFVGLILGTGLGAGIIANGHLVSGADCGAGEFGLIPYRDSIIEHYCAGQYFRKFGREGHELAEAAKKNDPEATRIFGELGVHLAFAFKVILYALAPERIILGGSVSQAWKFIRPSLFDSLQDFAYPSIVKGLDIKVSKLAHGAIIGASQLHGE